jgi:hypothetical protein
MKDLFICQVGDKMGYETDVTHFELKFLSEEKKNEFMKQKDNDDLMQGPIFPDNIYDIEGLEIVGLNEYMGRFSYEVGLWVLELQKYVRGWIEFSGEEIDDFWKIKITPKHITMYEGEVTFVEADERTKFINNGLDPWSGRKPGEPMFGGA